MMVICTMSAVLFEDYFDKSHVHHVPSHNIIYTIIYIYIIVYTMVIA